MRTVAVGRFSLVLEARDERLEGPLAAAFDGFTAALGGESRPLGLEVSLGLAPTEGLPEQPRLALGPDGLLHDDSEGWALTLDPQQGRGVARLRLWREDAALLRLQLESLARVAVATAAPYAGGLLVHGAALIAPAGERALLFVGASGAGKTTLARRLPAWTVLADDTVWLGRAAGAWEVAGTPFAGKERLPRSGQRAPLAAVVVLAPRLPLALEVLGPAAAFGALVGRVMGFAPGTAGAALTWDLLAELVAARPVLRLASRLEDDVDAPLRGLASAREYVC